MQGDQTGKDPPLATPAADVWALGVIAYEVLCGMSIAAVCKSLPPLHAVHKSSNINHDEWSGAELQRRTKRNVLSQLLVSNAP